MQLGYGAGNVLMGRADLGAGWGEDDRQQQPDPNRNTTHLAITQMPLRRGNNARQTESRERI